LRLRFLTAARRTAALVPLLIVGSAAAQGLPEPGIPDVEDPGFRLELQGIPPGMDDDDFSRSVLAALPEDLLDPQRNFQRSDLYRKGESYRLVLVFHDGREVATLQPETLCASAAREAPVDAPPPEMENLTTTTHVAAAFCQGAQALSSARDQMTGQLLPDQASFRFLVSDVAKQLFPDGFAVMPGTGAATAVLPPG